MNCPNCGGPTPDSGRFCKYCGAPLPAKTPVPPRPQPPSSAAAPLAGRDPFDVEPLFEDTERRQETPHFPGNGQQVPPQKRRGLSKGGLIALIAVAAALLTLALLTADFSWLAPDAAKEEIPVAAGSADQEEGETADGGGNAPEQAGGEPENSRQEEDTPPQEGEPEAAGEAPQYAYEYLGMTTARVIELLGEDHSSEYWNGSDSLYYAESGLMLFFGHAGTPRPEDTITAVLCAGDYPACPGVAKGMTLAELETALGQELPLEYSMEDGVETAFCELDGYSLILYPDADDSGPWVLGYYLVK